MPDGGRRAALPHALIRVATVSGSDLVADLLTGAYKLDPVVRRAPANPAHPARAAIQRHYRWCVRTLRCRDYLAADGADCAIWHDDRTGLHDPVGTGVELLPEDTPPPFSRRCDLLREVLRACHPGAVAVTAEEVRRLTATRYAVGPQADVAQPSPIRPAWRQARSAPAGGPADARARQGFAFPDLRRPLRRLMNLRSYGSAVPMMLAASPARVVADTSEHTSAAHAGRLAGSRRRRNR